MHHLRFLAETYEQMLRDQEPNFLRLYLSPWVAQTCFCLDRYVGTTWPAPPSSRHKPGAEEDCQTFLANGLEEALSGAIKLARYNRDSTGTRATGLIFDPADRLIGFASARLPGGETVPFLPGLRVLGSDELGRGPGELSLNFAMDDRSADPGVSRFDPVVLVAGADDLLEKHADTIRLVVRRHAPIVITCLDRENLAAFRRNSSSIVRELVPDIVVFDDSFVDHAVPFGAFTARKSLFACWNRPGKATFHSTTFQPNTISTRHFMECLAKADPDFYGSHREELRLALDDLSRRGDWFGRYYNPSLRRLIRATGFATKDIHAAGSFVVVNGRPMFDGVSGVACSFRGHNPAAYIDELDRLDLSRQRASRHEQTHVGDSTESAPDELRRRLRELTGLEFFLPAVSGATAVENALKVALVAQFPRRHILALKAGFGGKTLLSLTGTANPSYKQRIDPLYSDVHYVDPFAPDAEAQIDALMESHDFAVVQLELIQSVGGVRRVPESVVRHLDTGRKRWGYLLLVDEVQTGMYRTGPFIYSRTMGITPDFLLLGKATSDMMFPFALTLYSAAVQDLLQRQGSLLPDSIRRNYGYEQGFKTVVNVLRLAEGAEMLRRVAKAGAMFDDLLRGGLASNPLVRDVRVFGLLIGIELETGRWPHRWLRKRLSSFYLLSMLRHADFPILGGFCQYEPNVLKITPPLNVSRDEIRRACGTIIDVLGRPLYKVVAETLGSLIHSQPIRRRIHEHSNNPTIEPAAR